MQVHERWQGAVQAFRLATWRLRDTELAQAMQAPSVDLYGPTLGHTSLGRPRAQGASVHLDRNAGHSKRDRAHDAHKAESLPLPTRIPYSRVATDFLAIQRRNHQHARQETDAHVDPIS